jgi:lipoyl(octanoyl) transferase
MTRTVRAVRLGIASYLEAMRLQHEAAEAVRAGGQETLFVLQHPPVYTLGRSARREHLLSAETILASRGAEIHETDRGGDVTFHGPGQLIAYPILDLRSRGIPAADYVRMLEGVMIDVCARFGVTAERRPGLPGVWAAGSKLGFVGVRVTRGVSRHGFALNVEPDLAWFDAMVPCGLEGISVTSMRALLGQSPGLARVEDALLECFATVFDIPVRDQAGAAREEALVGR